MSLYCYLILEEDYDYSDYTILGHAEKYSHEEFDDICIKIMEQHGETKPRKYTVPATLEHKEEIHYTIDIPTLIKYLIKDYGFIKLEIPVVDGFISRDIQGPSVYRELIYIKAGLSNTCPFSKELQKKL